MRGLTRRWIVAPRSTAQGSQGRLGVEPLVERVLRARGLRSRSEAETFCEPRLTHLHEPSAIPDLDRAAERLLRALRDREPVVIYGDYDVDGVTASAILYHMAKAIAPDAPVSTYVPHRIDEGYGLSAEAMERLAEQGARVVVSVDCGVGAVEPAKTARRLGLDLIITDHHEPPSDPADLPPALAVVHPRRPGSAYPFGELSGAGVAYKLAWRLATLDAGAERVSEDRRRLLLDLLALAALGTIADVVPLIDENRVIARFGLSRLPRAPLPGLQALIKASGLDGDRVSAEHVGFVLGPRLNACGRMGHAREAVELLTTGRGDRARDLAEALTRQNENRRTTERAIFEQACDLAEAGGFTGDDHRAIVLAHEHWHPGVVGIVCSRLVERFGRPTILMQRDNGLCRGSCRSIEGFDIHAALAECAPHLQSFGGHPMAAGLEVRAADLPAFVERFTEVANERIEPDALTPPLHIDCDATLDELTRTAVRRLEKLGPFGRSNPRPAVRLRGLEAARDPEPLGARGKHLAILVRDGDRIVRLLAWNWGERRDVIRAGQTFDAVVRPKLNEWRGRVSVEPEVRDLAPSPAVSTVSPPSPIPS